VTSRSSRIRYWISLQYSSAVTVIQYSKVSSPLYMVRNRSRNRRFTTELLLSFTTHVPLVYYYLMSSRLGCNCFPLTVLDSMDSYRSVLFFFLLSFPSLIWHCFDKVDLWPALGGSCRFPFRYGTILSPLFILGSWAACAVLCC
jgi:hypothetical protein